MILYHIYAILTIFFFQILAQNYPLFFVHFFYSYSTKTFLTLAIVIIVIGILIIIGSFIFIRYGTHDEYYGMEIKDKKTINKSKDISYYDSVPCQGDLYKLFFVAGYFKILKNKSDFIGAILFKLYLNDNIELIPGKNGRNIKLRNDIKEKTAPNGTVLWWSIGDSNS